MVSEFRWMIRRMESKKPSSAPRYSSRSDSERCGTSTPVRLMDAANSWCRTEAWKFNGETLGFFWYDIVAPDFAQANLCCQVFLGQILSPLWPLGLDRVHKNAWERLQVLLWTQGSEQIYLCIGGDLIIVIQDEDSPCHLASELSRETVKELTGTQPQEFAKVSKIFNIVLSV